MGSAQAQGQVWGVQARNWADLMEKMALPIYHVVLDKTNVGRGTRLLDIGYVLHTIISTTACPYKSGGSISQSKDTNTVRNAVLPPKKIRTDFSHELVLSTMAKNYSPAILRAEERVLLQRSQTKKGEQVMSLEENKARVRQLYEEVFNKKNLAAIDDYFAANVIDHSLPPGAPGGSEGVKQTIGMFVTAFPDLHLTVEDLIAEGDRVVARWTLRGTHQGASLGMPPTGKQFTMPGISVVRLDGGKSVEQWVVHDQLGMLQQLGLIPAPAQAAS